MVDVVNFGVLKDYTTRSLTVMTFYIRSYFMLSTLKGENESCILSAECARIYGFCFGPPGTAVGWEKQNNVNMLSFVIEVPSVF